MAQAPYDRQYNFTNWQTSNPDEPLPAGEVDVEFNAVKIALNGTQEDLARIQKDDGTLANGVVDVENLAPGLLVGFTLKGSWAASTAYAVRDVVVYSADFYVCKVAHTSTASTPDTLTSTWEFLFDASALIGGIGVEDGSITEVKLATGAVTVNKIGTDAVITTKIGAGAVTNAKLANVAASTIKGRYTAGSGDPEDMTGAQARTVLSLQGCSISATAAAGALTVTLKGLDGAGMSATNPVTLLFRSATATDGVPVARALTANSSLVISSGSTLGVSAINTAFALWVVAFDDGGTVRLGVINCLSGKSIFPLGRGLPLASSTAEGGAGAADSAQVFYTGTAVTAKAYCILGRLEWSAGLAALGTWTAPTGVETTHPGMKLPGDIVQFVATEKTDTFTSTATGAFTDITGLSASITPTSAANCIRVDLAASYVADAANSSSLRLVRGSTAIGVGDAAGSRSRATVGAIRTSDALTMQFGGAHVHDAPGSASATTYKVQFYLQAGTFYLNRSQTDTDSANGARTSSQIVVTEIQT